MIWIYIIFWVYLAIDFVTKQAETEAEMLSKLFSGMLVVIFGVGFVFVLP